MISKKCNYNRIYFLFFLLIVMVVNLQVSYGIGESLQNTFETLTDISGQEEKGMLMIQTKKIMNYKHYEFDKYEPNDDGEINLDDWKLTNENVRGADNFRFQLYKEVAPNTNTWKEVMIKDIEGGEYPFIIPFSDTVLQKFDGKVKQKMLSTGEYLVLIRPELIDFPRNRPWASMRYKLKELDNTKESDNVKVDEREVFWTVHKSGDSINYEYGKKSLYFSGLGQIPGAIFNNFYEPTPVYIDIPISKFIDGRDWVKNNDQFTFTIAASEDTPDAPLQKSTEDGITEYSAEDKSIDVNYNNNEKSFFRLYFTFDDLLEIKGNKQYYVESKDFKYVISETGIALRNGLKQQAQPKEVIIRLKNNRTDERLECWYIKKNEDPQSRVDSLEFTNVYEPEPVDVTIKAEKQLLDGLSWTDEGFTFALYQQIGEQEEPIESQQVTSTRPYAEFKLKLKKDDVYTYIIKEVKGTRDEIYYNPHDHKVNVVVKPDDTGSLTAEVKYIGTTNNELIIRNEKKKAAVVTLQAKKESNVPSARKFSFNLQETDEEGKETAAEPKDTSNDENGLVSFSLNLSAGTHYYKMSEYEPNPKLPGWKYDKTPYLFMIEVNQQGATTVKRKVGETWEIYDNDNPVVFTNTYAVVPETVAAEIQIEKRLTGRRAWLEQDSFVFSLKSADGSQIRTQDGTLVSSLETSAHMNNKEPKFPPIYYKLEDLNGASSREFKYIIEETAYGKGITPDSKKEFIVTVENDVTEGKLKVKYGKHKTSFMPLSELLFINHYEINGVKNARIGVYKTIENRAWKSGDVFSFQIEAISTTVDGMADKDFPMPVSSTLQITGNNENVPGQANTKVGYFGEISYTIPGNYWYMIEEIIPGQVEEGMEYDLREYLVEVKIEDNGDGTLKEPTVIYYSSGSERRSVVNSPVFVNTYNKETHSYLFSFTKQWYGVPTDNVSFTLYNPDGTERKHVPVIIKESDKLWIIKYWLSSPGDYYAVENASNGYTPVYQNRGTHEEVQDRVYNGGRIINYQAPPTGDKNHLNALFIIAGICLTGILIYAGRKQNEK